MEAHNGETPREKETTALEGLLKVTCLNVYLQSTPFYNS